jgi:hypothetical protein
MKPLSVGTDYQRMAGAVRSAAASGNCELAGQWRWRRCSGGASERLCIRGLASPNARASSTAPSIDRCQCSHSMSSQYCTALASATHTGIYPLIYTQEKLLPIGLAPRASSSSCSSLAQLSIGAQALFWPSPSPGKNVSWNTKNVFATKKMQLQMKHQPGFVQKIRRASGFSGW